MIATERALREDLPISELAEEDVVAALIDEADPVHRALARRDRT